MKKVGFIGAYDKTDLILYIGRILTVLGKKVLIVDSTITQKAKYIVPVLNPTMSYITEFEEMDVAVGFNDIQGIAEYLNKPIGQLEYDFAILDITGISGFCSLLAFIIPIITHAIYKPYIIVEKNGMYIGIILYMIRIII